MSEFASREEFLTPCEMPTRDVPVPSLGGKLIRVKGLNAQEWAVYESGMCDEDGFKDKAKWRYARERLVATAAVDESGKRLFTLNDIQAIGKRLHGDILALADAISELSGRYSVGNLQPTTDEEQPSD